LRARLFLFAALPLSCPAQWSGPPFAPESAQLSAADLKDALGLLCPGQEYIGEPSGCHVCPQQTGAPGARTDSSIESAIAGHFLNPETDDLLLVLYGCSPRAGNFRDGFLFTRSTTGWFVSQASGLPVGRCRKVRNHSGRDALVCFADASSPEQAMGRVTAGYIGDKELELARAFDNTGDACSFPTRPVIQSAIQQVNFVPGPDGKLTLRMVAQCRRGPLSARSRKACAAGPGFEDIGPALPFRSFRFDYTFNGDTFSLAPTSRAAKQAYEACSAEGK
jgi:hypothetical protein